MAEQDQGKPFSRFLKKMKIGEYPTDAARRGLQEELPGIPEIKTTKLNNLGRKEETTSSPSYPGLTSNYRIHQFEITLNANQFNPNGYKTDEKDVTTYFIWKQIR